MNTIEKRLEKLEANLEKPKVEKYNIQIILASDFLAGKRNYEDFHIDNGPVMDQYKDD